MYKSSATSPLERTVTKKAEMNVHLGWQIGLITPFNNFSLLKASLKWDSTRWVILFDVGRDHLFISCACLVFFTEHKPLNISGAFQCRMCCIGHVSLFWVIYGDLNYIWLWDSSMQCIDSRCKVQQHIGCVIVPEKPVEGIPAVPPLFYCEMCRIKRADPYVPCMFSISSSLIWVCPIKQTIFVSFSCWCLFNDCLP